MRKIICFALLITVGFYAQASHIIGGELFYDYAGNNTYHVTLKLYRDCSCSNCAQYGLTEYVTIFDGAGNVFTQLAMPLPPVTQLPPTSINPCISPQSTCIQEADYTADVVLPKNSGYTMVYQRCCRSTAVVNLELNQGATYTAVVPDSSIAVVNSSARFNSLPPLFVCVNGSIALNYAANDPDGDSLVYSLCNPFTGADGTCPDPSPNGSAAGCPTTPPAPPYSDAIFSSGFSSTNPTNSPSTIANLQIDPHTGILTGSPNAVGVFDITVCVNEFRNGQLLNTLRRDFQMTVTQCDLGLNYATATYLASPGNDTTICSGDTVILGSAGINDVTYQWYSSFGQFLGNTDGPQVLVAPGQTTSYFLRLVDTAGLYATCNAKTDTVTVTVLPQPCVTSVQSLSGPGEVIKLAPNPAKDYCMINYSGLPAGNTAICIYNALGQLVLRQDLPGQESTRQLNIARLADGCYTYSILVNSKDFKHGKFAVIR